MCLTLTRIVVSRRMRPFCRLLLLTRSIRLRPVIRWRVACRSCGLRAVLLFRAVVRVVVIIGRQRVGVVLMSICCFYS
jgi:hypothetical protein